MRSVREEGLRLIQEAEGILKRDAQGALNDKDFNMVVRAVYGIVLARSVSKHMLTFS